MAAARKKRQPARSRRTGAAPVRLRRTSAAPAPGSRVSYLGPAGTYSHSAVTLWFGEDVEAVPQLTIEDVFRAVQDGETAYGVVPVENSSEGAVNITLDRLISPSPPICGEVELPVHHNLMGRMASLGDIKRVCAHPQALAQCRAWLDTHLPGVERVPVVSNAEGARRARDEEGTAGIAGAAAAGVYDVKVLAQRIEDHDDNTTRFLVLGRKRPAPTGADKTSLLVSGERSRAGSLCRLLEPLARHGINMTRIESRPSRRSKWEYVFFIDLAGHVKDAPMARALAALRKRSTLFRVLGSYPRAVL